MVFLLCLCIILDTFPFYTFICTSDHVDFFPNMVLHCTWHCTHFTGDLIRCLDEKQMELKYLEKYPENSLHPVMDSLDILGTCGWKINTKVSNRVGYNLQCVKCLMPRTIWKITGTTWMFTKFCQNSMSWKNNHEMTVYSGFILPNFYLFFIKWIYHRDIGLFIADVRCCFGIV